MSISLQILVPIILGITGVLAYQLAPILKNNKLIAQLKHKQEIVGLGIRFVEALYKGLDGEAKYNKAVEWITVQFNKHGLKTDDHELKALIEAMLQKFKADVSKQW